VQQEKGVKGLPRGLGAQLRKTNLTLRERENGAVEDLGGGHRMRKIQTDTT